MVDIYSSPITHEKKGKGVINWKFEMEELAILVLKIGGNWLLKVYIYFSKRGRNEKIKIRKSFFFSFFFKHLLLSLSFRGKKKRKIFFYIYIYILLE